MSAADLPAAPSTIYCPACGRHTRTVVDEQGVERVIRHLDYQLLPMMVTCSMSERWVGDND